MLSAINRGLSWLAFTIFISFEVSASGITLIENTSFIRSKGKPKTETVQFHYQEGANYQINLFNGGEHDQYCRISSAIVKLNGKEIFTQRDFNQQVAYLTKEVNVEE